MPRSLRLLAVLSLLTLAGCHRGRGRNAPLPEIPIRVVVVNHNWGQVRIYVVRGSDRIRLGAVASNRTETFELPHGVMSGVPTLQLSVNPLATNDQYVTDPLSVWPGDVVHLTVENQLRLSTATVSGG